MLTDLRALQMMASFRYQAISLYKRILRVGKSWAAVSGTAADTQREKSYINTECRRLFELNRHLTDTKEIGEALLEGESRLEIALHYKNPWPRPAHIPQHTMLPPSARRRKKSDRILHTSKPAYLKSYDLGDIGHEKK